jgi:hypothetical protein
MSWPDALFRPRGVAVVGWQLACGELLRSSLPSELLFEEVRDVLG